jgi:dGTPase
MNWKSLLSAQRLGAKPDLPAALTRSAFEQDYDRIIFSHPFRKLQDKTQVHPLPEHDFVHTRLTHSLEVSSVGRSLGKRVGEVILQRHPELAQAYTLFDFGAIVAAAALAHDIGNPPFGHAGEEALSEFFRSHPRGLAYQSHVPEAAWAELTHFEGNAQGFRLLNDHTNGLRLTYATLGAFTKYPCAAHFPARNKRLRSQKKFGFFQSEHAMFAEVACALELPATAPQAWQRHPLAFLVEAADDICYSIIDLEDGCRLGLLSVSELTDLLAPILKSKLQRSKLEALRGLNEKLGILRALAIGELMDSCTEIFLAHETDILSGQFDSALTELCAHHEALRAISSISVERIYRARHVLEIEAAGHQVLPGLVAAFVQAGHWLLAPIPSRRQQNMALLLPAETRAAIESEKSPYNMLRRTLDFVAGLTDRHALALYRKINGISL